MNGQNITKYHQIELNLMHITCKKTRNYIFYFATWQMAKKIEYSKMSYFTSEEKKKPNTTEFLFFYYNG